MHPNVGNRAFYRRLRGQICPPTWTSGALTGDLGNELTPQRGLPGPSRETYLTHLHPNAGHRGFHGRCRRQTCVPTRATGALTGEIEDKFVPQRGPPGPPRQTYLTRLCSDAGHQGLHRRLRAHSNIVTPARGVLTEYLEDKAPPQRGQLSLLRETWGINSSSNAGQRGPHGRRR